MKFMNTKFALVCTFVSTLAIAPAFADESTPPAPTPDTLVAEEHTISKTRLEGSTGNWMVDSFEEIRKLGTQRLRGIKAMIEEVKKRHKDRENHFNELEKEIE